MARKTFWSCDMLHNHAIRRQFALLFVKKGVCNPIRVTLSERSKVSHDISTSFDLASNVRNILDYLARPRIIHQFVSKNIVRIVTPI